MGNSSLPEHMEKFKFKPGQSGNPSGRRPGNRNKLAEAFLYDLYREWQQYGADAVTKMRKKSPGAFVRVVASILPKNYNLTVNDYEQFNDSELIDQIIASAEELGLVVQRCDSGAAPAAAGVLGLPKPD